MYLDKCSLCNQQVSPLAKHCPSCGHPVPQKKQSAWMKLSMQVPSVFYGLVFCVCGLAALAAALAAAGSFSSAVSIMHQQFAAQLAILAALLGLIAMVAAIAADKQA
jgi:hypothetical protein